jgi:RHS repeat-associated protein
VCEIDPATGLVCLEEEDFSLNGENPFFFTRRYSNLSTRPGTLGIGWVHPFEAYLVIRDRELFYVDSEARLLALPGLTSSARIDLPAEDIIAEIVDAGIRLHHDDGKMLTFSKQALSDGRLPLIRIDHTDKNSVFLSHRDRDLDELRTSSFHQLGFRYANSRLERIVLRTREGADVTLARYVYDANGQLAAAVDAENRPRRYEYDGGLLTKFTNRMGGSFYLEYDGRRRATAVWQDGLSRLRRISYDDVKHARLVTNALGHGTVYRYDEKGLLLQAVRPDGSRVDRAYANGNEPIGVTGAGLRPFTQYDPSSNVVREVDQAGGVAQIAYDERDRVIEEADPGGLTTRYEYDDHNRIVREERVPGGVHILEFNDNGNLVRHVQPLGNTVRANRSTSGRLELADSLGPLYTSEHDSFGNTVRITAASGRTTAFEYDAFGRPTALVANGQIARKWYDANGFLVAETDLVGNRTEYERDAFGLLLAWKAPSGRRIEYRYSAERQLLGGRSSDGLESRYDYDELGRLFRIRRRDGREETFLYDENRRRAVVARSGSEIVRYSYTPKGLLSKIESANGSATYDFDPAGNCTMAECDGHLVIRQWAAGGRLTQEEQDGFRIEYEHNVAGLVSARRDSTGRITRYSYDVRGQVIEIADSLLGVFSFRRDATGAKAEQSLPNGLTRHFEYGPDDAASRVLTQDARGDIVRERHYRYAPNGEMVEARTAGAEAVRFEYDAEYQLTGLFNDRQASETFAYDLDHNITYASSYGSCLYDQGRLARAGNISYLYDDAGRTTSKIVDGRALQFKYRLGGLIGEVTGAGGQVFRYEYDGLGRRVLKVGPGLRVRYYWDQDVLLCEERETASGRSTISYLYIPGTHLPLGHSIDGRPFYYELDQRSLIREIYDAEGVIVGRFAYGAYGERRTLQLDSAEADSSLRLQGQFCDAETGLHYNRFRFYDPQVGRYLSPDRFTHQVEHNPYSYSPNPINWADPLGRMAAFSTGDALALVEGEAAENGGWFECANCGFRNKNRVFATTAETGRPVGDGTFQGGHIVADANGGSDDPETNGQTEGGTCNCSKGKRAQSGMT